MIDNIQLRQLAETLVTTAGKKILATQADTKITSYKDRQDVCTTADLQAEKIIVAGIRAQFPDHAIQSEETSQIVGNHQYLWIIDPLDGTKEFVRGIPQFNSSIAVEKDGKLVASAIYRPTDMSLYSASLGDGAFLNGQSIHVSTITTLADSFIYCYLPSSTRDPKRYAIAWDKLGKIGSKVYRLRSYADENTSLAWLAQGGHEGYLNLSNSPKWHDVAPGILVAQEAGAYIPPSLIQAIKTNKKCSIIISNNDTIWRQLNNVINSN